MKKTYSKPTVWYQELEELDVLGLSADNYEGGSLDEGGDGQSFPDPY